MSRQSQPIVLFLLKFPRISGFAIVVAGVWLAVAQFGEWGVVAFAGLLVLTGLALLIGGEKFASEMSKYGQ